MFGEGVVEGRSTGPGVKRKAVAGLLPLVVQRVEVVEGGVQDAQLPGPAVLYGVGGQVCELRLGRGEQVTGAGADGFERGGGVGVALAGAQAVGGLVVGPAVGVGVLVGVGVPGVEDLLAVVDEAVEVVQDVAVSGGFEGDGAVLTQRCAVARVVLVFAGAAVVFGCRRRAARAWARKASSRVVCAATTCCGVRGLGCCTTL